jgi:hypothetical protein
LIFANTFLVGDYKTLTKDSKTLDKIDNYLGIKINRDVIKKKVGAGKNFREKPNPLVI